MSPDVIVSNLEDAQTEALAGVLTQPDGWENDPRVEVLRRAGRKVSGLAELPDVRAFVKAYQARPGIAGWKEALRRSPGLTLWHIGRRVQSAGLQTPAPLVAGEIRRGPFLVVSFFACEALDDCAPLDDAVSTLPGDAGTRIHFVERLAQQMRRARELSFAQSDLKPSNLFVRGPVDGDFDIVFTDLRRAAVGGFLGRWFRRKTRFNLRHRILEALGFTPEEIDAFFAAYDG